MQSAYSLYSLKLYGLITVFLSLVLFRIINVEEVVHDWRVTVHLSVIDCTSLWLTLPQCGWLYLSVTNCTRWDWLYLNVIECVCLTVLQCDWMFLRVADCSSVRLSEPKCDR